MTSKIKAIGNVVYLLYYTKQSEGFQDIDLLEFKRTTNE